MEEARQQVMSEMKQSPYTAGKSPRVTSLAAGLSSAHEKPKKALKNPSGLSGVGRKRLPSERDTQRRKRPGLIDLENAAHHIATVVEHFEDAVRSNPTSSTRILKSMILRVFQEAARDLKAQAQQGGFAEIEDIFEAAYARARETKARRSEVARAKMSKEQ